MSIPPEDPERNRSALSDLADRWRWRLEGPVFWRLATVVVVLACAVAWMALRGRPTEQPAAAQIANAGTVVATDTPANPASTVAAGSAPAALPGSTPSVSGAPVSSPVVVDVVGPVRRPGVISLPSGSRVGDAIAAAGGFRPGRGELAKRLNLARILQDGEQIDAGAQADQGAGSTGATGQQSSPTRTGPINLNQATVEQLDQLPRIGPVTAQKIIDFRQQHGGFRTVEQLKEVPGIGDRTFEQLAPLVRV